ncbi:MAG: hypothetical protein R3B47_11030 [Bacteroidia bacterium]
MPAQHLSSCGCCDAAGPVYWSAEFLNPPAPEPVEIAVAAAPAPGPDGVENGVDVGNRTDRRRQLYDGEAHLYGLPFGETRDSKPRHADGWLEMIRWMQKTENSGILVIMRHLLDYLAKHYGPEDKGRRQNIEIEEWYEISARRSLKNTFSPEERNKLIAWIGNE